LLTDLLDLALFDPPARRAEARARELLASLLRPSQLESWRRHDTFWLHTTRGGFRLGTLYDIRYRATRAPWVERSICVVTEGYEHRPLPDLWAELAVAVQTVPEAFTAEANFRAEAAARAPGANDVIALRQWLEQVRATYGRLRQRGADLDAAYLAFDTAHRVSRSCRPAWAAGYAERAAELVHTFVDRYPDERAHLLEAHHPVFTLAERTRPGASTSRVQPPSLAI
jgi:hypothetical protein